MSRVIRSLYYFSLFIVVFELTDLRDEEEGRGERGSTVVLFITLFSLSFFLTLFYSTWWKQDGGSFMCWSTPLIHWLRSLVLISPNNLLICKFYLADYEAMYEVVYCTPRFQVFSALARRRTSLPWVFLSTLFDSHEDFVPLSSVQKRRQPKWVRSKKLQSTVSQDFVKNKIQDQTCPLVCWKCVGKSAPIDERSSKWYPLLPY